MCRPARSAKGEQLQACQVQSIRLISTDALDVQPERPVLARPSLVSFEELHQVRVCQGVALHAGQHHGTRCTSGALVSGKASNKHAMLVL